jgi:ATPase subunit of ABC transporter with duplicated ATPase domains
MDPIVSMPGNADSQAPSPNTPSITFESLTFSDGTVIALEPTDVVRFVGPNHAGKSAALRDIEAHIGPRFEGTVIKVAKLRRDGTIDELREIVETHTRIAGNPKPHSTSELVSVFLLRISHTTGTTT